MYTLARISDAPPRAQMSEETLDSVRDIRKRLQRASRRIDISRLLFGLILTLAVASGIWVVLAAAESILWMGRAARSVALGAWIVASAGMLLAFVLPPALRLIGVSRRIPDDEVALLVGERFPDVSDRLINLIQLSTARSAHTPDRLLDGAVSMLSRQVGPVRFEDVERFDRPRKAAVRSFAAPAALVLFALLAPDPFSSASQRLLAPGTSFEPPPPFLLHVSPGDVELTRGEALVIEMRAEGQQVPADAVVTLQQEDVDEGASLAMTPTGSGRFEHRVGGVRQNLRYRVEAGGVVGSWYDVRVVERPFIRGLQLRVDPPAYTGLPPQRLTPDQGDVTALKGSQVHITTTVGGIDIEEAVLAFSGATDLLMTLIGDSATASFQVDGEDSYRVIARSADGVLNADPIMYQIQPLSDAPPAVRLVAPGPDETLGETLEATLAGLIVDDYGFSRLDLRYRLAESRYRPAQDHFEHIALPLETPRPVDQEILYHWRLSDTGLDPVPGDVIEYYLEVWDNDAVSGSKSARSSVQRLRVPSLSEQFEELDQHQESTQDELQRLLEDAGDIRRDFDQLRQELRGRQEADWQSRRQVESLQQRQEAMERRVDELTRQMEDVTRQMEDNQLLSEETVEMYRQLTRVVEEINSPELMDALRQLQEAIDQLDLPRMQESLQDFQFSEEQYRQRLERSLELFKRMRTRQQLEQAERMARDLAQRQDELREATEQSAADDAPREQDDRQDAAQEQNAPQDDAASEQNRHDEDGKPDDDTGQERDASESAASEDAQEGADQQQTSSDSPPMREQLAREQERLSEDMEQLEEKLDEVRQQMNESRPSPTDQMEQLRENVRQQQLPEKMRETGQQIRNNQMQDAGQQQQQMQQQLDALQQQLGEMRSGMSGAQMQLNLNGLRRTIRNVIALSQEQEGLQNATTEKGSGSPALRDMARSQVRLAEGVGVVADSIQSLAQDIPQMSRDAQRHTGEALREMSRATEALAERSSRQAGTHQRAGMTHLNELALMLSDLLDQLMSQQSGSGGGGMSAEEMADQLQQMSQDQQRLNEQIQQMLNDVAGDRLTTDMQERLRQMAAQQDEIRRQLRQLSRDPAARDELMHDLGRIAEQMQETIEELQRRGASRQTIERQQQILTRLLEAEQSLQEREQDERREGRSGDDIRRASPPELQRSEEMEKLRRDLLRALENDYAPDYQDLIRRYFELLRRSAEQD